jgi:hypothetical protein
MHETSVVRRGNTYAAVCRCGWRDTDRFRRPKAAQGAGEKHRVEVSRQAPLIRDENGAILGVDWRRVPGMTKDGLTVPGLIPAWAVMPGDRAIFDGQVVTVVAVRHAFAGALGIIVRTDDGAEIVHERDEITRVEVIA